jgi:DnaJ-class molecular chaperone
MKQTSNQEHQQVLSTVIRDNLSYMKLGDLVYVIDELPHSRFKRKDDNLIYNAKISLVEALTGCIVEVVS